VAREPGPAHTPAHPDDLPASTYELVARAAELWPERAAVSVLADAEQWETPVTRTFAQLAGDVHRAAGVLASLGVGRGDAVAVISVNCDELLSVLLAAEAVGTYAPINPGLSAEHATHLMRLAGARVMVASGPELDANAWMIACNDVLDSDDTVFAALPLLHTNALLVTVLAPLLRGQHVLWAGPLGYRDVPLYGNFWKIVERYRVAAMSAVPTVYQVLAQVPVDSDISSLRLPIVGAAPLPAAVREAFAAHTGVELCEGYGLTEGTCASSRTVYARLADTVEQLLKWPMQPVVRGVGLSPLPRPERLYFWFGEPVDTSRYAGRRRDPDAAARALRDEVKAAVESGIAFLHDERERDPNRSLIPRLRRRPDE
jgi:acyl-CoA synthetase (AMP-forming)/AMP-acid ligase II